MKHKADCRFLNVLAGKTWFLWGRMYLHTACVYGTLDTFSGDASPLSVPQD